MDDDWLPQRDETAVRLSDLPAAFEYHYDLGDGWEHDVEVLGPGADEPGCRYGEGACPPEDCGGPHGYASLLEVLADPAHPEHAAMKEWAGELADFDQAATDRLVRQVVGAVPASLRLVLDLAEGGVRLTPAGRFPRALVRRVQQERPHWSWSDRPASLEDDLLPLVGLHELVRAAGLLRLSRGTAYPTKVSGDDLQVVRRVRAWFAADPFREVLAVIVVAVLLAEHPCRFAALSGRVHAELGTTEWTIGGQPLSEHDVQGHLGWLLHLLIGLDMIVEDGEGYRPGPSAHSVLTQVAALAAGRRRG